MIRWALRPTGFVGVGWGAWLERQGRAGKAGFPWLLLGQALCVGVGKAAHLLLSRTLLVAFPPIPRIQTLPVGQSAQTSYTLQLTLCIPRCTCCRMLYEEISKVVPLAQQGLFLHVVEDIQTSIRCVTCSEPFQVLGCSNICVVYPVHLCAEPGPPQSPMLSMLAHTKRHLVCRTLPPVSCPGTPPVPVRCPVTPLSLTPALSLPCLYPLPCHFPAPAICPVAPLSPPAAGSAPTSWSARAARRLQTRSCCRRLTPRARQG